MNSLHDKMQRQNMQAAADALLDPHRHPGELLAAAHALRESLGQLAQWHDTDPEAEQATALAAGVAISPSDAARCTTHHQRTACFLRGTLAAIEAAQAQHPGPIDVIYAGCGPLAPLAVGLCHRLQGVTFWPVDVHDSSIASVRRLVTNAGYDGYFGDLAVADACTHQWPGPAQVAVVEVMQQALLKEPQIAVTANLARQLVPGGLLVPQSVRLDIQQHDPAREFELDPDRPLARIRVPVTPFLELTVTSAEQLLAGHEIEFQLNDARALPVIVTTAITVHENVILDDYDCSPTVPWPIRDLGRPVAGTRAILRHVPGPSPHLVATRVDGSG